MPEKVTLWNPLDPHYIDDPYGMYEVLRKKDPVHKSQTGEWILTRYKDVKYALSDKTYLVGNRKDWFQRVADYSSTKGKKIEYLPKTLDSFLLFKNPPDHRIWRDTIESVWPDPSSVQHTMEHNLRQILKPESQEIDFIADFARPFTASVIGSILGLSNSDSVSLSDHVIKFIKVMDLYITASEVRDIEYSCEVLSEFFKEKIKNRSSLDQNGIIYKLSESDFEIFRSEDNQKLAALFIFLFVAGLETSASLISLMIFNLIKHPGHLIKLKHSPERQLKGMEELIRYDSPVQLLGRIASKDHEIGGKKICKGDTLTLVVGAANRDPEKFPNPDDIDFNREQIAHLSFGAGPHFCLGDRIARLEASLVLKYFASNFTKCEILEEPEWIQHLSIRGLKNLKVELKT